MYTCNLNICFVGCDSGLIKTLQNVKPLPNFKHTFTRLRSIEQCHDTVNTKRHALFIIQVNSVSREDLEKFCKDVADNSKVFIIIIGEEPQLEDLSSFLYWAHVYDIWVDTLSTNLAAIQFRRTLSYIKLELDKWELLQEKDTLCNGTPNMIWVKTADGKHTWVNNAFCDVVGKTKSFVIGKKHPAIWDTETDPCKESEDSVMLGGKTLEFNECVERGGKTINLITYKSPLYDCDGSVMGTIGMAIDTTQELKYASEAIQHTQNLRKILDNIDCGVLLYNDNGVVDINRKALKLFGFKTKEEFAQYGFNTISSIVHPDDRIQMIDTLSSLQEIGDTVDNDYRLLRRDGSVINVIGSTTMLQLDNGDTCYQRLIFDYTAKNEAESRLLYKQQQLLYTLAVDYTLLIAINRSTYEGEIVLDKRNILKRDASNIVITLKNYVSEFVTPDDRQLLLEEIQNCLDSTESGSTRFFDYREVGDGDNHYHRMRFAVSSDECILGAYNVSAEIRRSIEQKELLENAVTRAESASNAKSNFLTNMSHDLRTPLNAISSFTTLAQQNLQNPTKLESYLTKVESASNELLGMINNILMISNIDNKAAFLREDEACLKDIILGAVKSVQREVLYRNISVITDVHAVKHDLVFCDSDKMIQMLSRILDNATKYNETNGTITIYIAEEAITSERSRYIFTIEDTGIGMSPDQLAVATELFSRSNNTTQSGVFGTGVGLTIAKSIVDMMQGQFEIESVLKEGTTVTITLNLAIQNIEYPTIDRMSLGDRVLVVTDNFHLYDTITSAFDLLNIETVLVGSVDSAVLMLKQLHRRGKVCKHCFVDYSFVDDWSNIAEELKNGVVIPIVPYYTNREGVSISQPVFMRDIYSYLAGDIIAVETTAPKCKILVVEDNEINQELMQEILQERGAEVVIAGNGEIAVDIMKSEEGQSFSLILMDLQMPVMNGFDATRAIRELGLPVPIIAVSANSFTEDRDKAYAAGMSDFIPKPVDMSRLNEILETLNNRASE